MPKKPSAKTLKWIALKSLATNCELVAYGCAKGSPQLSSLIEEEEYLDDPGPFEDFPPGMLEELTRAMYEHRAGLKHLLHLVIHSQTTVYDINPHGSSFVAMRFLAERLEALLKGANSPIY